MLTLTHAEVNDPGMNPHQRGLRCEKYWMDENEVDFAGWLWFVFKKKLEWTLVNYLRIVGSCVLKD